MKGLMTVLVVLLFVPTAFGAGGGSVPGESSPSFGGSFSLDGFSAYYNASNYSCMTDKGMIDHAYASASLSLDNKYSLDNANWSLYRTEEASDSWRATLNMFGRVVDNADAPDPFSTYGNTNVNGLSANENIYVYDNGKVPGSSYNISGSMGLNPAVLTSVSFAMNEYQDYYNPSLTRWQAHYYVNGHTSPVPEPSAGAFCLAGLGLVGLAIGWRKLINCMVR